MSGVSKMEQNRNETNYTRNSSSLEEFKLRLLLLLTHPDPVVNKVSNDWLLNFQKLFEAWEVGKALIEASEPENQIAGAQTLAWKARHNACSLTHIERQNLIEFLVSVIQKRDSYIFFDIINAKQQQASQFLGNLHNGCPFPRAALERLAECVAHCVIYQGLNLWPASLNAVLQYTANAQEQITCDYSHTQSNTMIESNTIITLNRCFSLFVIGYVPLALESCNKPEVMAGGNIRGCATDNLVSNKECLNTVVTYVADTLRMCSMCYFMNSSFYHAAFESSVIPTSKSLYLYNFKVCLEACLTTLQAWFTFFDVSFLQSLYLSAALCETFTWLCHDSYLPGCLSGALCLVAQYGDLWNESDAELLSFVLPENEGESLFLKSLLLFFKKLANNCFITYKNNEKHVDELLHLYRTLSIMNKEGWWLNDIQDQHGNQCELNYTINVDELVPDIIQKWNSVLLTFVEGYPQILLLETFDFVKVLLKICFVNHHNYNEIVYQFWSTIKELWREKIIVEIQLQEILINFGCLCVDYMLANLKRDSTIWQEEEFDEWNIYVQTAGEILCDIYFLYESCGQRSQFLYSIYQSFSSALNINDVSAVELILLLCDRIIEALSEIPAELIEFFVSFVNIPDDKNCAIAAASLIKKIALQFTSDQQLVCVDGFYRSEDSTHDKEIIEGNSRLSKVWMSCLEMTFRLFNCDPTMFADCIYDLCMHGAHYLSCNKAILLIDIGNNNYPLLEREFICLPRTCKYVFSKLQNLNKEMEIEPVVASSVSAESSLYGACTQLLCQCSPPTVFSNMLQTFLTPTVVCIERLSSASLPLIADYKMQIFRIFHRLYRCIRCLHDTFNTVALVNDSEDDDESNKVINKGGIGTMALYQLLMCVGQENRANPMYVSLFKLMFLLVLSCSNFSELYNVVSNNDRRECISFSVEEYLSMENFIITQPKLPMTTFMITLNDFSLVSIGLATLRITVDLLSTHECSGKIYISLVELCCRIIAMNDLDNLFVCDDIRSFDGNFGMKKSIGKYENMKLLNTMGILGSRGGIVYVLSDVMKAISSAHEQSSLDDQYCLNTDEASLVVKSIEETRCMELLWNFFSWLFSVLPTDCLSLISPYFECLQCLLYACNSKKIKEPKGRDTCAYSFDSFLCNLWVSGYFHRSLRFGLDVVSRCGEKCLVKAVLKCLLHAVEVAGTAKEKMRMRDESLIQREINSNVQLYERSQVQLSVQSEDGTVAMMTCIEELIHLLIGTVLRRMHQWQGEQQSSSGVMKLLWRLVAALSDGWNSAFAEACKACLLIDNSKQNSIDHNSELPAFCNALTLAQRDLLLKCLLRCRGARVRALLLECCLVANGNKGPEDLVAACKLAVPL